MDLKVEINGNLLPDDDDGTGEVNDKQARSFNNERKSNCGNRHRKYIFTHIFRSVSTHMNILVTVRDAKCRSRLTLLMLCTCVCLHGFVEFSCQPIIKMCFFFFFGNRRQRWEWKTRHERQTWAGKVWKHCTNLHTHEAHVIHQPSLKMKAFGAVVQIFPLCSRCELCMSKVIYFRTVFPLTLLTL